MYSGTHSTTDTNRTSKLVLLMEVSFVEGSFICNIIKYQNGTRNMSLVVRCPLNIVHVHVFENFKIFIVYKTTTYCSSVAIHVHVHCSNMYMYCSSNQ